MRIFGSMTIFDDPVTFYGHVLFGQLPKVNKDTIIPTDTTPDISNKNTLICLNVGVVNVTNFDGGIDGQTISLLGDGFTTIINGATIKTNTGVNKLLVVNKVYRFTLFTSVWVEDA